MEFEGETIVDANQFTNIISMLSRELAGGSHLGTRRQADHRPHPLGALPYEPIVKKTEEPAPEDKPGEEKPKEEKPGEKKPEGDKPEEKKPDAKPAEEKSAKPAEKDTEKPAEERKEEPTKEKPAEAKPADEKPAEKDPKKEEKKEEKPDPNAPPNPRDLPKELPKERLIPQKPKLPLGEAGKIRDNDLNKKNAAQILARWREQCGANKLKETSVIFKMESALLRDGKAVGGQQVTIASGGRCRVDYLLDGEKRSLGTDGKIFWLTLDGKSQEVSRSRALRDPHFSQAVAFACAAHSPAAGITRRIGPRRCRQRARPPLLSAERDRQGE